MLRGSACASVDTLGEKIIVAVVQYIATIFLLSAYVLAGTFGPASVRYRLIVVHGETAFSHSEQHSLPDAVRLWAARKHTIPEKITPRTHSDFVIVPDKIGTPKSVTSLPSEDLPFSATAVAHYAPSPRSPPAS